MPFYLDYNKDLQNIAATFVNGTAELEKYWPAIKSLQPGIMNVENQPLVEQSKVLLPSMHLKLGLMKNFVKAMNQEEAAFTY